MHKAIDIWQRIRGDRLARCRCFEVMATGRFCVQSCDFYDLPMSPDTGLQLDAQFVELLAEESPDSRNPSFETLEEAIARHRSEFAETE